MNIINNIISGKSHRLARSNYMPRIIGFAASFLVMALVGMERGWPYRDYIFMGLYFLVYPHLVFLASKAAEGEKYIEINALKLDAFMVGLWTAHLHFLLWMSYAFLSAVVINSVMVGGFRELLKGLSLYTIGALIWGTLIGFKLELHAPFYIELLAMICLLCYIIIAGLAFYNQTRYLAYLKVELEDKNDILNETVEELESTRDELVQKAHEAGMADLATGVLHNVGNILNSVNISSVVIEETLRNSKIPKLKQANKLLSQHHDNLDEFLLNDPRGKKLLDYYLKLDEPIQNEYSKLKTHCERLTKKVNLIVEVIDAQQDFAKIGRINEKIQLESLIEDTLTLQAGSIERHSLDIEKDFAPTDKVLVQKSKLIHILINLFKNAKEAMSEIQPHKKKITIRTFQDQDTVYLSVSDCGQGISPRHQQKVFTHGFTTKKDGHGYGLHTCANYMTEMDGKITASSEGTGKGSTFTLHFPRSDSNEHKNKRDQLTKEK